MSEVKESRKPDWKVVLETYDPKCFSYGASEASGGRPRRDSLHMIASCVNRDPLVIAKEMEASGEVCGYICPDVQTPIFYLDSLSKKPGMIDTRDAGVWKKIPDFVKNHPFPAVRGFRRHAQGYWTGGSYGKGKYVRESKMPFPFIKEDLAYAQAVVANLRNEGYEPWEELCCDDCLYRNLESNDKENPSK